MEPVIEVEDTEETPAAALARMLTAYRTFMENVFSLLKFIEGEMVKRGWEIVRNGGYGVTRNGYGRGLSSFAASDWVTTYTGIAFVKAGTGAIAQGVSITQIPVTGLNLVLFDVWWYPQNPDPVVWRASLLVQPEGDSQPRKWEEYQSLVFARMDPESDVGETRAGRIKPGRAVIGGAPIVFTGDYIEVPVTEITSAEGARVQLIDDLPAP